MKKGYYIYAENFNSSGVSKKIKMQIEALSSRFIMKEVLVKSSERTVLQRIYGLLFWNSFEREYQAALNELDNPDFVYIRMILVDRKYLAFLKGIKEKYPMCNIIVEIPTYPYKGEMLSHWYTTFMYVKEIIYRHKYKEYIDRFVTFSEDDEILGVPTICTINGINVENIAVVKGEYRKNSIRLIGVAHMQKYHGYERIIEGLREYYQKGKQKYTIELLLVGDGTEREKYYKLVEKYDLSNYVKLYHTMSGAQLDELYDISDMALASFGVYKYGFYGKLSQLKTREYLAKGMPILTGCEIDVLDENYKYVRNFENGPRNVDMLEIVTFFENITKGGISKQEIAQQIRQYALQNVSMETAMKPIIDYIES